MDIKQCRLCLQEDKGHTFRSLFETIENDLNVKFSDRITSLTKIQQTHITRQLHTKHLNCKSLLCLIYPNDGLPGLICNKCTKSVKNCSDFITLCQQSDVCLRNAKIESDDVVLYKDKSDDNVQSQDENNKEIEINNKVNTAIEKSSRSLNKYQCYICGRVMSSSFRLKTHIVTHTGERQFSCSQCGRKFSLAQNLKVHMRIHTGEKPFTCLNCGAKFAHSSGLSVHKKKHLGQYPYSCTLCPRKFRTVGHLQYHVRRHTGQMNFECESCGRAFITRNDLKNHLLTHSITKRLVCSVCGLRLSRPYNLKRHIKLVHNATKVSNNLKNTQILT